MMPQNNPLTDDQLAELDRLHAAATPGEWQARTDIHCVCAEGKVIGNIVCDPPDAEKSMEYWPANSKYLAALHNAYPALRQRLAEAEAYRDEVEAAKPTVQALLDSGERAASEAADLRQRLTAAEARLAEAERERVAEARKDGERLEELAVWAGSVASQHEQLGQAKLRDIYADLARCARDLAKVEADDIEIHRTAMQMLHGPYVKGWVVYRDHGKAGHGYGFTLAQAIEALPEAVEAAGRLQMRTKAEALENPMAGDRWGMGGNEFVIRKYARGRVYYYNSWLFRNDSCPLAWFEAWAAHAKYLGGAND